METEELDKKIVLASQSGLAIVPEPYQLIAKQLGVDSELVMERLLAMQKSGKIRRIGVVPNHYRLGYVANGMSVWDVPDELVSAVGHQVGEIAAVSHCYHRPRIDEKWPYNLFAMVHGKNHDEVREKVSYIASMLGDKQRSHDVLFSTRILKKTGMRF
ncbi:MAG: siroheme decarboxylase subunit beta [bacterium]